ncbi:beta-ketoacyl-ACP synthase II [Cryomorphaceae bacterium 1068]|nr:beta-ketoacyl-ACP synthase II [Cryomorphaceae bacterium 1068]
MSKVRVVVTGLGAVSPIGNSSKELWENALKGKNGVGPITRYDASLHKTHFACEIKGFDPTIYLDRNEIKRSDIYTQYSIHCAAEAVKDSGIDFEQMSPYDVGVIWGTGKGGVNSYDEESSAYWKSEAAPRFGPFFVPKMIPNIAPGMISMKYGLMGVNFAVTSACASSNHAIIDAFNNLLLGRAKVMICGGAEAGVTAPIMAGFSTMRALSADNDDYERASRPFDVTRNGFVMGEGGAAIILEELEHAKARGAKIYAELAGTGSTADAYHLSSSHPDGIGAIRAMELAMEEAGVSPEEIGYINAHATSTPVGDISEVRAISKLFSGKMENLIVGATKSMTGHLIGGAGAVESVFTIKAIQDGVVAPTINTVELDPAIPSELKIAGPQAQEHKVNAAISNTFGFGGHNTSVLYKKFEE